MTEIRADNSGSHASHEARSDLRPAGFDPSRKHAVDYEIIPWRFVPRSRRKGYMDRDFFISTRRYQHFASGANADGVIRYGYLIGDDDGN